MGAMKRLFETIEAEHGRDPEKCKAVTSEVTSALNGEVYWELMSEAAQNALSVYAKENGLNLYTLVQFMENLDTTNWAEYPDHEYPYQEIE